MRPHQPHPSLLRYIHPAVPKRHLLLPQGLVDVGLLGAGDPGFFPVGWAVVAGQEQYLHGLGCGDGSPEAEDAGALGLDAGPDPVLRAVDEVGEAGGVDEDEVEDASRSPDHADDKMSGR